MINQESNMSDSNEEEYEVLKSIKVELPYPDKDGKITMKLMTINTNKVVLGNKSAFAMAMYADRTYAMDFTLKIPDHVFSKVNGKVVHHGSREISYKDLKKTIVAESIRDVTNRYCTIVAAYNHILYDEKANLRKVIFYEFSGESGKFGSTYNGAKIGDSARIEYRYFVGYISEENRYNIEKQRLSASYDKSLYDCEWVEWTQERQDFFDGIQKSFISMQEKIAKFKESIKEVGIEELMNGGFLALNQ